MTIKTRALVAVTLVALIAVSVAWARFKADSSGASMAANANAFLASLKEDQKQTAMMPLDAPQRTDWHFIPKDKRKGLQIREMDEAQRKKAHALLESSLSKVGYDKAVKIMELENLLKEL